ncbi:MAG: hypothetical protein JWN86_2121 [Planctomycetota bacterium]|nr:hypothetical protein [Planctomycetota bacterium]
MKIMAAIGLGMLMLAGSARSQESKSIAKDTDKASLVGNYELISGEDNGKPVPEDHIKGSIVRITDDDIVMVDRDNKEVYVTKYKLDTKAKPARITMTETGGPRGRKGQKAVGIIERDGDRVRLCYCYEGGIVPTEFRTRAGEKQLCFTMKRKSGE